MCATHLVLVLFGAWIPAAYAVLRFLADLDPTPPTVELWLYWGDFALLSLAAVIVPLFAPRHYVPFDTAVSSKTFNPSNLYMLRARRAFEHPAEI